MVNLQIQTIPESRENSNITEKYIKILKTKNEEIANLFKTKPKDITLQFYDNKGILVKSLGPNQESMGVYSGYVDGTNEIKILHPSAAEGLLDDIEKELTILIVNTLTKLYLCKKYYPQDKDFKLYHKYLSQELAKITAGNYQEKSIKFDLKLYFDGIKYKKDQELQIALYLMLKNSGLNFIYENLDTIMQDLNIKKSFEKLYNKPIGELIKPLKEQIIEEERKIQELEKQKRAAQREAMINERKERELKMAQQKQHNNQDGPKRVHISSQKFGNRNNQNRNNNNNQNGQRQFNNQNNNNNSNRSQFNSNRDKANYNNPNNPNYKKKPTQNNPNNSNKNFNRFKKKDSNEPANKPQKFATPKVNFNK